MANVYVNVTLHKDSAGNYSLSINPLTALVSHQAEDDGGNPVTVTWVLREDPNNPDFPNATRITASFKNLPTPFTNDGLPESYTTTVNSTAAYDLSPQGPGAIVVTPAVRRDAVGDGDERLFAYTITVRTKDGTDVLLDPHIRVRRQKISKGNMYYH
ncbi:MAG TPA: hypothetical protein VFZ34_33390 [Blastocatellia bacterium]|nr:hypothetical protein [Blastocatellia bacterium]